MSFIFGLVVLGVTIMLALFLGSIVLNIGFMILYGIFGGIAWIFNKVTGRDN